MSNPVKAISSTNTHSKKKYFLACLSEFLFCCFVSFWFRTIRRLLSRCRKQNEEALQKIQWKERGLLLGRKDCSEILPHLDPQLGVEHLWPQNGRIRHLSGFQHCIPDTFFVKKKIKRSVLCRKYRRCDLQHQVPVCTCVTKVTGRKTRQKLQPWSNSVL